MLMFDDDEDDDIDIDTVLKVEDWLPKEMVCTAEPL